MRRGGDRKQQVGSLLFRDPRPNLNFAFSREKARFESVLGQGHALNPKP